MLHATSPGDDQMIAAHSDWETSSAEVPLRWSTTGSPRYLDWARKVSWPAGRVRVEVRGISPHSCHVKKGKRQDVQDCISKLRLVRLIRQPLRQRERRWSRWHALL